MAADTTKKHFIRIRGANVNNLKNLSVDIPRDKFVVFTGLSGSGKSSLAFDTIYAVENGYLVFTIPARQCRGTASLYGISLFLCKTVPGTDGEAGCGEHRRSAAGHFH